MPTGSGATSPTPPSNINNAEKNGGNKSSTVSYDPTPYIQRARVTRPAPPKPSVNPLQFVQIKPCSLYQSAQEQLKKAEEVKKVKEIKKEEPEDWQSNLDNWKSSRRKRVEHIIDRVVEVKKLEMEEHDRTRRKSKTFSEMLEERGSRRKLSALPVYTEDEANDLSDLGIGTSSASGKSSLSEDCDNQSVMSDNVDTEKPSYDVDNNSNHRNCGSSRDYISSPGYDTSTSTAPTSSPDPCEYTYEGAIQDYKTRVSRAQAGYYNNGFRSSVSKDSTPERSIHESFTNRRMSGSKIEDRLINFEVKCTVEHPSENNIPKKDLPKVDIHKRRELFEKENSAASVEVNSQKRFSGDFNNTKSIRERLSSLEKKTEDTKKLNRLSGDITSIKDRLQNLEKQPSVTEKPPKIDVPVVSLKDRLTSLQSAAMKEEAKKPVALLDEHDLEVLKREELEKQNTIKRDTCDDEENLNSSQEILNIPDESNVDTDREDSGIHTTDVSCSVSQTDEQPELVNEENHHHINEDGLCTNVVEEVEEDVNSSTSAVPDVVKGSFIDKSKISGNRRSLSKEASEEQQTSSASSEPSIDQETSVSLSESPTASIQTIIFNDKLISDAEDTLAEGCTSSQHVVEGTLGACRNVVESSSKSPVIDTNTSLLTSSSNLNSKSDHPCANTKNKSNISSSKIIKSKDNCSPVSSPTKKAGEENRFVVYDSKLESSKKSFRKELVNSKAMEEVVKKCQEYLDTTKVVKETGSFVVQEDFKQKKNSHNVENDSKVSSQNSSPLTKVKVENTKAKLDSSHHLKTVNKIDKNSNSKVKTNFEFAKPKIESFEQPKIVNSLQSDRISDLDTKVKIDDDKSKTKSDDHRRDTVIEVCKKVDVRDLPKAANIPTPYFNIDINNISENSIESKEIEKIVSNVQTSVPQENISSTPNSRPGSPKNGVIVAKLEVVETTIKVTSMDENSPKSQGSTPNSPTSPTINPKTHPQAKPKNIFDFLKKNFSPCLEEEELDVGAVSINSSKFYVPLEEDKQNNEVNIEITRTVRTERIVEETDSVDPELTITSEINQLLDEELSKLTVEDTKL